MRVELGARRLDRKLPVDLDTLGASFFEQGKHFAAETFNCRDASVERLTRDRRELALNHIQPACTFRRVDELKAFCQRQGLLSTQVLIERARVMRVEIVEHQPDALGSRIHGRKLLANQRELALRAPLVHLSKPLSREWLDRGEQGCRAELFIFVVLLGDLTFAHGPRQKRLADQETRALVKAHDWVSWIIRQRIERQ